ncbi:hypothetical protein ACFE04_017171 [Oxalis oulophora]
MDSRKHLLLNSSSIVLLVSLLSSSRALGCALNKTDEYGVAHSILVDPNGQGNFTKIQDAVNSIRNGNNKWIRIQILSGRYMEQVTIIWQKTCIFLDGAGPELTSIERDGHGDLNLDSTFCSQAENIVVRGITFKNCNINVTAGAYGQEIGYVTAQRRDSDSAPGGFVFKNSNFSGSLNAYLGRPWQYPYARVLVYHSYLSEIIKPEGWSADSFVKQKNLIMFSENSCSGPGANTSGRVLWMKNLTSDEVSELTDISYINSDAWLSNLPNYLY